MCVSQSNSKAVYGFASDFVRKTSQYLEPYIQLVPYTISVFLHSMYVHTSLSLLCSHTQFFNNALVVGRSAESEVAEHIYDLILELHAIDSSILLSVMPQLEFKLKVWAPLFSVRYRY